MCTKTLHTTILHWGKKMVNRSWDWNPIWQMLSSNQQVLKKMLELRWCHDCKLNHLNFHYFVQIFDSLILIIFTCLCSCKGTNCTKTTSWASDLEDPITNACATVEILFFLPCGRGRNLLLHPFNGLKEENMQKWM
jgi:hypothetical protein